MERILGPSAMSLGMRELTGLTSEEDPICAISVDMAGHATQALNSFFG